MEIDIYAFSANGARLCDKIIEGLKEYNIEAYVPSKYASYGRHVKIRQDSLYISTEKSFANKDCIIFIGAAGIAIRAVAPFVRSKRTDPAVLCIDEKGINVISLLSGHIGGANQMTLKVADIIGGNPIITTATDINGKFAVDQWATYQKLYIMSLKAAGNIASAILDDEKIGLDSDFEIIGELPEEIDLNQKRIGICISLNDKKKPFDITLNLVPKIISVGVGCRRGTDFCVIHKAVTEVLDEYNISPYAISSINSIALKKNEEGIIKTAKMFKVPFNTFTGDELNNIDGEFSDSDFVKSITGVDSVCERAASASSSTKKLVIRKTIKNSVTVAACMEDFKISFDYPNSW